MTARESALDIFSGYVFFWVEIRNHHGNRIVTVETMLLALPTAYTSTIQFLSLSLKMLNVGNNHVI